MQVETKHSPQAIPPKINNTFSKRVFSCFVSHDDFSRLPLAFARFFCHLSPDIRRLLGNRFCCKTFDYDRDVTIFYTVPSSPSSESCTVSRNHVTCGLGSAAILHSNKTFLPPSSCLMAGFCWKTGALQPTNELQLTIQCPQVQCHWC